MQDTPLSHDEYGNTTSIARDRVLHLGNNRNITSYGHVGTLRMCSSPLTAPIYIRSEVLRHAHNTDVDKKEYTRARLQSHQQRQQEQHPVSAASALALGVYVSLMPPQQNKNTN